MGRVDIGPVEYVIIEFPGNRFTGAIEPAMQDLVDRGVVRILDLVFVKKDAEGTVTAFEYDDLEETVEYVSLDGDAGGLLSDEDVRDLAAGLLPNSSAMLVLFEDLWARELGAAVRAAGGELVDGGRLSHAVVADALAVLETAEAGGSR